MSKFGRTKYGNATVEANFKGVQHLEFDLKDLFD